MSSTFRLHLVFLFVRVLFRFMSRVGSVFRRIVHAFQIPGGRICIAYANPRFGKSLQMEQNLHFGIKFAKTRDLPATLWKGPNKRRRKHLEYKNMGEQILMKYICLNDIKFTVQEVQMKSIVIIEITKRNRAFLSCTGHLGGDWGHICICKNQLV